MSPLKYRCISCGFSWGNLEANENDISHGICKSCLRSLQTDLVRKRQIKEGFSDCYAHGYEDCTELMCYFWSSCLDSTVKEWKERVENESKEQRKSG